MFIPSHSAPSSPSGTDLLLIHRGADLLVASHTAPCPGFLPARTTVGEGAVGDGDDVYLGTIDGNHCYARTCAEDSPIPAGLEARTVRSFLTSDDSSAIHAISLSRHLLHWHKTSRFCGGCGSPTILKADERAKECPACKHVVYPRISPAVITVITRGDEVLLARNTRYRMKFYSLIAGFVEPGEKLEDTVRREAHEEVGVTLRDVRYYDSQPWPFPDSLMIGFTAEWESGEIQVDGTELEEAAWFKRGSLPDIPPPGSISRTLIDWFANQ
jgi:NAD+ diphosphatase